MHAIPTENQIKIASLGGIEAIIDAMCAHKDESEVQANACGVLNELAKNEGLIRYLDSSMSDFTVLDTHMHAHLRSSLST